jgi:chromosome segregation ATPase
MNKLVPVAGLLILSCGVYGYTLYRGNQSQAQQLTDYSEYVAQLLSQVESNTLQRVENDKLIQQLRSDLNTASSQLTAASNQLMVTQEQVSPDYQRLESEIRNRINNELRQQQESRTEDGAQLALIKQLSALEPSELGSLMSLQGRYGSFLNSLNTSDERLEVIVGALNNMLVEQNQVRTELLIEARSSGQDRRQLRAQLGALDNNVEAQLESLSFALTEEELTAFSDFQELQETQNPGRDRAVFIGGQRNGVLINPEFQSGSGRSRAIQLQSPPR